MLTLFRRIRKDQLQSSQTRRYILYAIGEIIIVVVGIMIALQINNWNEERLDQQRLLGHYKSLYNESLNNLSYANTILALLDRADQAGLYIKDILDGKIERPDTLRFKESFLEMSSYTIFNQSNSAYNSLVSSGDIQLIQNDSLKALLGLQYNKETWLNQWTDGPMIEGYNDLFNYQHYFTDPSMFRNFLRTYSGWTMEDKLADPLVPYKSLSLAWEKIRSDKELLVKIERVLTYRFLQRMVYEIYVENTKELLVLIDKEMSTM